jgi:hypothetical protein
VKAEVLFDESGKLTRVKYRKTEVKLNLAASGGFVEFDGAVPTLPEVMDIALQLETKSINNIANIENIANIAAINLKTNPNRDYIGNIGEQPTGSDVCLIASAKAKALTHGCYGLISTVRVRCKNISSTTTYIGTVEISNDMVNWTPVKGFNIPPNTDGYVISLLNTPLSWNHDKGYLRFYGTNANIRIYYDETEPDGYQVVGGVWVGVDKRYFIQILVDAAETVPVGGGVDVDIIAQSIGNLAVDIVAQTIGNLAIDIAAQTIGNLNVNLAAQTADIDVNVTNASITIAGAVTITTLGGTNIIIDKLTQGAYTERQSTFSNDDNPTAPAAPTNIETQTYRGKFFPRGMRGYIETISLYCKRTGAGTITLAAAPYPGMGPVLSGITVTPGAGWAFVDAVTIRSMWNYDSLFIWVTAIGADCSYGYSGAGTSPDLHYSTDSGVSWLSPSNRFDLRVTMKGQTIGDLPVSGTINTIEIPAISDTLLDVQDADVDTGAEKTIITYSGIGHTEFMQFYVAAKADSEQTRFRVYCDDHISFVTDCGSLNTYGYTPSTPRISLLRYAADGVCYAICTLRFSFRRQFKVTAQAVTTDGQTVEVWCLVNKQE